MHPIAIQLGPIAIHWYGVCVAVGFLTALWTAAFRGRSIGLSTDVVMDLGIWMIVAGIAGARLFYVIGSWDEFASHPLEIIRVDHGGLVFYGGFIAAVLAAIVFARRKKLGFWRLTDVLAPSLALGHMFGRLGCFMNGCCYGRLCSLPWAVHFPVTHETHGVGVHPTEIYEAIGNFLIFAGLSLFYRKRKFDGQVFVFYVLLYAVLRFCEEFFRGDWDERYFEGRFTPGHIMAFCMFVVGLVLLWVLPKRLKTA